MTPPSDWQAQQLPLPSAAGPVLPSLLAAGDRCSSAELRVGDLKGRPFLLMGLPALFIAATRRCDMLASNSDAKRLVWPRPGVSPAIPTLRGDRRLTQ